MTIYDQLIAAGLPVVSASESGEIAMGPNLVVRFRA
jgi:hypothetical protein